MTTFGLLHGAWHGAWCWERLTPELERAGHRVVAMDLPIDDPHAGLAEYAGAALAALPEDPDTVLVGHSLGASVIPLVAAVRTARRMVFLCPVVREPGRALSDQVAEDADMASYDLTQGRIIFEDASSKWLEEAACDAFYNACDAATAQSAASRLRRQYWRYWDEPNTLQAWPAGERQAIICTDDRLVTAPWGRRMLPLRLGVEPVELPGDHSPFLSQPARLAEVLLAGL